MYKQTIILAGILEKFSVLNLIQPPFFASPIIVYNTIIFQLQCSKVYHQFAIAVFNIPLIGNAVFIIKSIFNCSVLVEVVVRDESPAHAAAIQGPHDTMI